MRAEDYPAVRCLDLFAGMAEARFEELVQRSFLQIFPPQLELFQSGDTAEFLHVLIEGSVELWASSGGRDTTMAIIEPVSCFILAAVFNDAPLLMSARTLTRSRILLIPGDELRKAIPEDGKLAESALRELSVAYRTLVRSLKDIKLRPGVERLANYLLRESAKQGGADEFALQADKRTIAALLGMTPENLSRAFGALGGHGLKVIGPRVSITDRGSLKRLAQPDHLIDDTDR